MSVTSKETTPSLKSIKYDLLLKTAPPVMLERGSVYHKAGRVTIESNDDLSATASIRGSRWYPYKVQIWIEPDDARHLHVVCDCPFADSNSTTWCKHKVASLLALRDHFAALEPPHWSTILKSATAKEKSPKREAKQLLFFGVTAVGAGMQLTPYTVKLDLFDPEILDDKDKLAEAIISGQSKILYNRVENQRHMERLLNPTANEMAAAKMLADQWRYYNWTLSPGTIIPLLTDSILLYGTSRKDFERRLFVVTDPAALELEISRKEEGITLSARISMADEKLALDSEPLQLAAGNPSWVIVGSRLFQISENSEMVSLFTENGDILIPYEEADQFFTDFLPALSERMEISGDGISNIQDLHAEPKPRLYLRDDNRELNVELRFAYDSVEVTFNRDFPTHMVRWNNENSSLIRLHRDPEAEMQAWKQLSIRGLKRGTYTNDLSLRQNVSTVDFLIHQVPKLLEDGYEIYGEENLRSVRVNRDEPSMSLSVSSGIDWFDVKAVVNFGDLEVALSDIRRALRRREKYVKLADGSIGAIPEDWIDRYRHLFDVSESTDDGLRLSKSQIMFLDGVLAEADASEVDDAFTDRLSRLKDFSKIEPKPIPAGFVGELRHYQKVGYDWLHFLHEFEFGGCLADDMGIGKTIQTLVLLQSLRENGHAKTADIIVMPRSLLGNWEREAAKFTPNLKILIHADLDRSQEIAEFDNYDLILTTYGIARRDIELLKNYRFHYAVLDESQAVKNPQCHTARAVRQIRSDHKLVLTGTPVENSTTELWSQFAFLNPGMLGSFDYFRTQYGAPIERRQDQIAAEKLRALIYPFILRRTKELVAPELPPRTERIIYCDLEPAQQKLYERKRDEYRALLLGMIEESGMNNSRMKVLEGLLRLRQICNHPKLVLKNAKAESAKMEVLLETLETLTAENHKALVFSQFTQMLKLIREELDKRQIPYLYLDGQTKNRQELVDQFQENTEVPFFLISLKAGGVGLNLTAADYVIHIDPWWNPAVERQASDRTHRIGQDNPVFINKLIARGTVEEKMLELQDRKRDLVNQLITTESSFFKSLTADDVKELFS